MKPYLPVHPEKCPNAEGMRSQSGFTLIELLIVIMIIGILATIASVSFESLVYGSSSNRAALELVSDLQLARMTAIRTHQSVTVSFNTPDTDQYTVTWNNGQRTVQLDPRSKRVGFGDAPSWGGSADASFTFDALGFLSQPSGSNIGYIYLVDKKNQRHFGIVATASGGIDQRAWSDGGSYWLGPEFINNATP